MSAIDIEHLKVHLGGKEVLAGVTAAIAEGKVVGLLGPSGSGKTTLIRTIVGLQRPTAGHINVFGVLAGSKQLRSEIGYMTQAPSVYGDLTVRENLSYFAAIVGESKPRAATVIKELGLGSVEKQLAKQLSGGQLARVSLAVALLAQPPLLVLDEPTVGLDPILRQHIWDIFHHLAKTGTTILVSSHVMDEARRCDELLLLREGALLAAGTPRNLMTQTSTTDVEQAFIKLVEAAS